MSEPAVRGRILIAEDNPEIAMIIRETLVEKGYEAVTTETVAEAKRLLNAHFFDLAVVDLGLMDGSGEDVCRHAREATRTAAMPIIMLTGAGGVEDMARGIEAGADYYLTKPIPAAELLLWVRSLLRRVHQDWDRGTTIGVPGLRINPDIRTVWCDRKIVRGLTAKEFDLLLELARAYPKPLSQRELFHRVWGRAEVSNTLAVHVQGLRRKLGLKGGSHVVTTPDGYRLE
jgi:DNA-binding response OmpR family regulator